MIPTKILIFSIIFVQVILALAWFNQLSFKKAFFAILCRSLWLTPILLCFFPKKIVTYLPRALQAQKINVFIDDSESMQQKKIKSQSALALTESLLSKLEKKCEKIACKVNKTYFSKVREDGDWDKSDLASSLNKWLKDSYKNPWFIVTDGADSQVSLSWDNKLSIPDDKSADFFYNREEKVSPLILAPKIKKLYNLWIDSVEAPAFSFQSMSTPLKAQSRSLF